METFIVGRLSGGGADIAVPRTEDTVGRRHAELQVRPDGSCTIRDLGSTNGTFVQEHGRWSRVSVANVGAHQNIRLGDYVTTPSQLLALTIGTQPFDADYQPAAPLPQQQARPDPMPVYQAKTYDPYQGNYSPQVGSPSANEPLAVWSFVLSLIGLFCCGGLASIPAIICGHVAISRIGNPPRKSGKGLAIAGLVLGYIGILLILLALVYVVFLGGLAAMDV